jgi:hypothetical protein
VIDWTKVKCDFAAVRVGYGRTVDKQFLVNWKNAKVKRIPYWYMDYYSNHIKGNAVNGLSDIEWGIRQADMCHSLIKDDPEAIVFLDVESTNGSFAPKIQEVPDRVHTIAKSFLERMDQLNGKVTGGYWPIGWLTWFPEWFKNRPLWVAWYNNKQTKDTVLAKVKRNGWTGKCLMWQFSSTESMSGIKGNVDANGWIGTEQDYKDLFRLNTPTIEDPVTIEPTDKQKLDTLWNAYLSYQNK